VSINDLVDHMEAVARAAVLQAKAVEPCRNHPDVLINRGSPEAEKLAYAIATNALKAEGEMFLREDVMSAVQDQIVQAAEECAECSNDA
jgi:hypothetical protein